MTCPTCGTSNVVAIDLRMAERQVTMRSCGRCDRRWWASEGEKIELPGVLELAATRR